MAEEEAVVPVPLRKTDEGEGNEMKYIHETILKKRKGHNVDWALRKKQQLEERKFRFQQSKADYIKKAEEFIKDYRDKELDLIRMKQRTKRHKPAVVTPGTRLLFIIRVQGGSDMHPKTRKILYSLGLTKVFTGVFMMANEGTLEKLKKVEPYVTYGYPNLKSVRELINKKGSARIDGQRLPLTDNEMIERELGKYGIVCLEDIVHEIANVGPHFKEVTKFLWPFVLTKPEGGLKGNKILYKKGGDTGDREDHINELISKMN